MCRKRHYRQKGAVLIHDTRAIVSFIGNDIAQNAAFFFLVITEHCRLPYLQQWSNRVQRDQLRVWVQQ